MGNNHSNDYRPDPTRADRIRGGNSGDKQDAGPGGGGVGPGGPGGGGGNKKNGYRSQLSTGPSPSHGASGVPVLPVTSQMGR